MNDPSDKKAPDMAALQKWIDETRKRRAERDARERAHRATLTPAERAREARQREADAAKAEREKIIQQFKKMGALVLARESWTIPQFAWLIVAEDPTKRGKWWDDEMDEAAEHQKKIRALLESCVGVTLIPLEPTARREDQRYRVSDLLEIAAAKHLGHAVLLKALLESLNVPYGPSPETLPGPQVKQDSPKDAQSSWLTVLSQLLDDIEEHVRTGRLPQFRRDELPWSLKTLNYLLESRYQAAGYGKLPVKPDTVRKRLNKLGWKAKGGNQDASAASQLKALFER